VFGDRTIIGAYAARPPVLRTADPTPHRPVRLPKHVRYHCATPRTSLLAEQGRCALDRRPVVARLAGKAISGQEEHADAGAKPGLVGNGHGAIAIHSADDVAGKRYVGA
jgi:hypothetical protein